MLKISEADQEAYRHWLVEYFSRRLRGGDDEAVALKWILAQEPKLFERQLSFIDYVEIRSEGGWEDGCALQRVDAAIRYGVSGLHAWD